MRLKVRDRVLEAIEREILKERYLTQWHPYFCLIPRRVGDEVVWLETIQRKGRFVEGWYSKDRWEWEYRIPMTTLLQEEAKTLSREKFKRSPHCLKDGSPCVPDGAGGCVACGDGHGNLKR